MYKTDSQIVYYDILYLNRSKQAVGAAKSLALTLLLMTNSCTNSLLRGY